MKGDDGEPNGMLIDKATLLVEKLIPSRSRQEEKNDLEVGISKNISLGWTQVQIAGGTFSDLEILEEIKNEGNLKQRVYLAVSEGEPANRLLQTGAILDSDHMLVTLSLIHI